MVNKDDDSSGNALRRTGGVSTSANNVKIARRDGRISCQLLGPHSLILSNFEFLSVLYAHYYID